MSRSFKYTTSIFALAVFVFAGFFYWSPTSSLSLEQSPILDAERAHLENGRCNIHDPTIIEKIPVHPSDPNNSGINFECGL